MTNNNIQVRIYHDGDGIPRTIEIPKVESPSDKIEVFEFDDNFQGYEGYTTPGWYFYDETESAVIGPYVDSETAQKALDRYAVSLSMFGKGASV